MSNLLLRFLTAVVAVPLLILAINWDKPYGVWLWVLAAQITGLREWMVMTLPGESPLTRWLGVAVGVGFASALCWVPDPQVVLLGLCAATIIGFLYFLFRHGAIETVAPRVSMWLAGLLYAGVLIVPLAGAMKAIMPRASRVIVPMLAFICPVPLEMSSSTARPPMVVAAPPTLMLPSDCEFTVSALPFNRSTVAELFPPMKLTLLAVTPL